VRSPTVPEATRVPQVAGQRITAKVDDPARAGIAQTRHIDALGIRRRHDFLVGTARADGRAAGDGSDAAREPDVPGDDVAPQMAHRVGSRDIKAVAERGYGDPHCAGERTGARIGAAADDRPSNATGVRQRTSGRVAPVRTNQRSPTWAWAGCATRRTICERSAEILCKAAVRYRGVSAYQGASRPRQAPSAPGSPTVLPGHARLSLSRPVAADPADDGGNQWKPSSPYRRTPI
jgi:hypothetical protein